MEVLEVDKELLVEESCILRDHVHPFSTSMLVLERVDCVYLAHIRAEHC